MDLEEVDPEVEREGNQTVVVVTAALETAQAERKKHNDRENRLTVQTYLLLRREYLAKLAHISRLTQRRRE